MNILSMILLSVLATSLLSFIGVVFLAFSKKNIDVLLPYLISFAVGGLLGDAFIHLLPETFSLHMQRMPLGTSLTVLASILLFFIVEKILLWHQCPPGNYCDRLKTHMLLSLISDGVHNMIDGIVIASSFLISIPLGISTTIAVALHELPQEISDFGTLLYAGLSIRSALGFNVLISLTSFVGALLVYHIDVTVVALKLFLVPLTAGGFIYIACSMLIPALHKHRGLFEIVGQVICMVAGIAVMVGLLYV